MGGGTASGLADRTVHRAALLFVRHGTIGANTFPSGHTAVSFAIAFALLPALPIASAVCFALAVTIAVACVVGRYHYVVDVITGTALALAVWAFAAAAADIDGRARCPTTDNRTCRASARICHGRDPFSTGHRDDPHATIEFP